MYTGTVLAAPLLVSDAPDVGCWIERCVLRGSNDPAYIRSITTGLALHVHDHICGDIQGVHALEAAGQIASQNTGAAAEVEHSSRLIDDEAEQHIVGRLTVWRPGQYGNDTRNRDAAACSALYKSGLSTVLIETILPRSAS